METCRNSRTNAIFIKNARENANSALGQLFPASLTFFGNMVLVVTTNYLYIYIYSI